MLTVFSKEEFIALLDKMEDEKRLDLFRMRIENARIVYQKIISLCSDKQIAIAAHAFFYGIDFE